MSTDDFDNPYCPKCESGFTEVDGMSATCVDCGHTWLWRNMTIADIQRSTEFHEANSTRSNGTCYVWRKNGALKLWKTRPDDFRQPVKYGLRTFDAITPLNADYWVPADKCPHCAKLTAKLTEKADAR